MKWYNVPGDPTWVRCANSECRTEFLLKSILSKRKCPNCKLTNARCFAPKREPIGKRRCPTCAGIDPASCLRCRGTMRLSDFVNTPDEPLANSARNG
jgi:hypothetical protein